MHFLAGLSAAGTAGILGTRSSLADEGPPEVPRSGSGCGTDAANMLRRSQYIAEDLLRAEGFTDIRYVAVEGGSDYSEAVAAR